MLFSSLLAASGYYYFKVPAKPTPAGGESALRFKSGRNRVVRENFQLVDANRPTQAYKNYSGLPYRILKGEIWRPAAAALRQPLVVYSHGFLSNRRESLYLVSFLASHGYTVVGIDYPLTNTFAPSFPHIPDIINQPGDISFLIDYLLKRNSQKGDSIYKSIDPDKIAVAGVSLGGLTSILACYHRDLLDSRIAAAISIAGPTTMFAPDFYQANSIPTLMVYGDADSLVLYEEHAVPALSMISGATLVTLKNASHTGFVQPASTFLRLLKNPDSLMFRMITLVKNNKPWDFISVLGGPEIGITHFDQNEPPRTLLIPVAMKAARQQMFTTLAVHAFFESLFADSSHRRNDAHQYLVKGLPGENADEVSVSQ